MRLIKKSLLYFAIILLGLQTVHSPIYAMSDSVKNDDKYKSIIVTNDNGSVPLLEQDTESSNTLIELHDNDEVIVLENLETYSFVQYVDEESNTTYEGYVLNEFLEQIGDESDSNDIESDSSKSSIISSKDETVPLYERPDNSSDVLFELTNNDKVIILEELEKYSFIEYVDENSNTTYKGYILNTFLENVDNETELNDLENNSFKSTILTSEDETVPLLEKPDNSSDILFELTNNDKVIILKELKEYSFIEYVDENSNTTYKGYILNTFLENTDNETELDDLENNSFKSTILTSEGEAVPLLEKPDNSSNILFELTNNVEVYILEKLDSYSLVKYIDEKSNKEYQGYVSNEFLDFTLNEEVNSDEDSLDNEESLEETTKEDTTEKDVNSNVDDDSIADDITQNESNNEDNNKEQINEENEEIEHDTKESSTDKAKASIARTALTSQSQKIYNGVALKDKTKVYQKTSTNSKVLKSYNKGSILIYKSLSNNWYEALVYINGKPTTGYIHHNDVENIKQNQTSLRGIGLKDRTNVYSKAATNSKVLKSYDQGSVLLYKTFTNDWYEALVYVNGKPTTGYIHKSHVENINQNQTTIRGVGVKKRTNVYSKASTNSKVLKSYGQDSILLYKTFTSEWYEALVYVNGKPTTGYIHKSDVKKYEQTSLRGIGIKNRTNVYSKESTNSKVLKSYAQGSILLYKTFSNNWYEALVYVNGKPTTGYIHHNHVENLLTTKQEVLKGRAKKAPTNVYQRAAKNSGVLKSYKQGSVLMFKTFSRNWYEALVFINGKPHTGYIHANDVTTGDVTNTTNYDYSLKKMVDTQMTKTPKSDGAGKVAAKRSEVEFYVNPLNFAYNTPAYYQFLILTASAGMDANEINEKILYNKGILKGTGQAFINASKKYNINEAYLISHTLHETGNGTSKLASGIPVDKNGNVTRDSKGNIAHTSKTAHTVYNMYGYGAIDNDPINGGAKYAFNQKWFSPSAAIEGGAESIVNSYIKRGQDTLYKMRWNPASPGYPQYATHVAWATIQSRSIYNIYSTLDNYTLVFDVPKFANQVEYGNGVYGTVKASTLNFRSGPSTGYNTIGSIPNSSKVEILGADNDAQGWYNIKYNGKVGWVSAKYVYLNY
ncbi:hypothetical protein DTX80_13245 [Bacilli bacterium]|nr:hypothetical protein DEJ64_13405 [Bacilli bacterium]PZD85243.1 hypothetical protein DEJ60_12820 [Bacilli bacterium]PZD88140.1 hypothetical protein DEJ66_13335 [Bacilli bacterium]RCO05097.1 hypothetical protein DTX80_13245 [Bacilli bacterium]RCO10884.1 hypothetical protein DTX79_02050 [Bacilli bacterium]